MSELHDNIHKAVEADQLLVSLHARQRMRERSILLWQITSSLADGTLLLELPEARPHPAIEVKHVLPDGTEVKAVWSYDAAQREARLVTVHYFDR